MILWNALTCFQLNDNLMGYENHGSQEEGNSLWAGLISFATGHGYKGNKTQHIEERKTKRAWAGLRSGAEVSALVASDSVSVCHFATLCSVERTKKNPSLKEEVICVNREPYGSENDNNKIDILRLVLRLFPYESYLRLTEQPIGWAGNRSLLLRLRTAVSVIGMSQHVTAEMSHAEHWGLFSKHPFRHWITCLCTGCGCFSLRFFPNVTLVTNVWWLQPQ